MTYLIVISSVFGLMGIIANVVIFWQRSRESLLIVKLLADIVWTLHYAFIGAWMGMASCGISIIRETVFLNKRHRWAKSNLWAAMFILLSVTSCIITWESAVNILLVCAAVMSVISFAIAKPRLARILQIFISACFLTYDIWCGSYAGIVNEFCTLTSVAVAMLYYMRKKV